MAQVEPRLPSPNLLSFVRGKVSNRIRENQKDKGEPVIVGMINDKMKALAKMDADKLGSAMLRELPLEDFHIC